MTYMLKGRQYIVLAVSGRGAAAEYIAFRLTGGAEDRPRRPRLEP